MFFDYRRGFFVFILIFLSPFAMAAELSGEKIYARLCSSCHGFTGEGRSGLAPALRNGITVSGDISGLLNVVMNGRKDTLMVAFKKNMTDDELAAVISYVRERFGPADRKLSAADIAMAR